MNKFTGRRRDDTIESSLPPGLQAGDYWKILNADGTPKVVEWPGKLTQECWHVVVPWDEELAMGPYAIGNLEHHTVREEEDGTISVRPNDGSSNSILISGPKGRSWHGYIEHGVFRRE